VLGLRCAHGGLGGRCGEAGL